MLSSDCKDVIREHYGKYFYTNPDDFMILPNDVDEDGAQVDVIWIKPTKEFNYNVLATCGLSELLMQNPTQAMELIMLLPPEWKFDKKDENWWPIELLSKAAYMPFKTQESLTVGSVISLTEDDGPFMKGTKNCGLVVTLPEHLTPEMFEIMLPTDEEDEVLEEEKFLRFYQVVPVNKDDIERIQENGVLNFIKFNLHNAEGPDLIVKKR